MGKVTILEECRVWRWKWRSVKGKKIPVPAVTLTVEEHRVENPDGTTTAVRLNCFRKARGNEPFDKAPEFPKTRLPDDVKLQSEAGMATKLGLGG